jgi:hydrogenase maturation protease
MSSGADRAVVIGLGNALGGDDAAGLLVARRVRDRAPRRAVREYEGDPTVVLDALGDAALAVLVDAIRSDRPAGTVVRFDVSHAPLPATLRGSTSTHAMSVAEVIELARSLGRLPVRTIVYGIEGATFAAGEAVTPAVAAAVDEAAARVLGELAP